MSQSVEASKLQSIPKSSILLPVVKEGEETDGMLTFTMENTNVSIANAIRRTILSDINTVIMNTSLEKGDIKIFKNTTRFNNEILKQRLGSIPVHIKEHDAIDDLLVEIDEVNDTDSMVYVTTKDFKIKNISSETYLTSEEVGAIFPHCPVTKGFVLFARLRPKISTDIPGQELKLECKLSISNASKSGMYNAVSTCAYENSPDRVEQNTQWQTIESELEEKGYEKNDIDLFKENWYLLKAKRFYLKDSFKFKIETVGVYTNRELVLIACDTINKKLNKIYEICQNEKLILNKNKTTMENCVDITLENEDYTIGKVIEYILHEEYYKGADRKLDYVGFIKLHPHDTDSIIRICFNSGEDFNDSNINALISFACQSGVNIFNNIKEYF